MHAVQLTSRSLEALLASCYAELEELDMSWCRGIGEDAVGRLVDGCPNLRRLHAWGCTQLTPRFLNGHGKEGLLLRGVGETLKQVVKGS
jgi:DNA repair protein RAD7